MCLRFKFCTHQRVCILHFLNKSQIRCTLLYISLYNHGINILYKRIWHTFPKVHCIKLQHFKDLYFENVSNSIKLQRIKKISVLQETSALREKSALQ
jgi:hypothetical protein